LPSIAGFGYLVARFGYLYGEKANLVEALVLLKYFYYLCFMKNSKIYTKEILEKVVKNSINFSQVCRYFGKCTGGGSYQLIQNRIKDYGIDTSHFLGKASQSGERQIGKCAKRPFEYHLRSGYKYRMNSHKIRKKLIESGREYICEKCGNNGAWNNKSLTLHVDHKDGDWSNCVKENLRFLCPNCHSQTNTYSKNNRE